MKFWAHLRKAAVSATGVTDNNWYTFLAKHGLDEDNFSPPFLS